MAPEDLPRLAQRHRIAFKPPGLSDQWPAVHRTTFENITKIGKQRFDTFCASIDIHSNDQPWREHTKNRADWLAKRASQLFNQRRNEAGWRFGLENDVLRRFSFEVACLKCRARIWRSEVEAHINECDGAAANLEERRKNRTACYCSPQYRPLDYYEVGTNLLFDDRTQEAIVHDPLLRLELPKQEPDRVYGLQATRNFQDLLSEPAVQTSVDGKPPMFWDTIRTSPFKEGTEPLLFPFLILEAKSEDTQNGFAAIQNQTALPIMALLKLQRDLRAEVAGIVPEASPLVWFFANRGDAWRVYGCYVTADNPPTYEVVHLWDGCLMARDDALQLLLIVDYIFDWARDVYRPSILRQLKSVTSGQAYDQVSLANDSDIFSLRGNISNWIQLPPSNAVALDLEDESTYPDNEHGRCLRRNRAKSKQKPRSPSSVYSGLSDEDLADICCILRPISHSAIQVAAFIHEETPRYTISTNKSVTIEDGADSKAVPCYDIALRLSADLKEPALGFLFSRDKKCCDFLMSRHCTAIEAGNIHFRIYIDAQGKLMLQDFSRKDKSPTYVLPDCAMVEMGSLRFDNNCKFHVCIPRRETESEHMYLQNLAEFYRRRTQVAMEI